MPRRCSLPAIPDRPTRVNDPLAPSYIGFYLIEVQLPPITNLGTSELYLSAGGQESNRVPMVLEP